MLRINVPVVFLYRNTLMSFIMSQTKKIVLPPCHDVETVPFIDGEEAWFWFSRCQVMRDDGARFISGMVETPRPCTPDDVYRSVMTLYRARLLENPHLKVLGEYGEKMMAPDERCREERSAAQLWGEALDQLANNLRKKGIVE